MSFPTHHRPQQLRLRLDHTAIPFTDIASRSILDAAVLDLTLFRGGSYDDPGSTLSVLVSFIADAQDLLPQTVADARDFGYTWDLIAGRLGSTVSAARYRYSADANWLRRRHP